MENEIWKDVEGWEGIYCVSNMGNVKSMDRVMFSDIGRKFTVKGRILKPKIDQRGYYKLNLAKNQKIKTEMIHRLVCEAFHKNPYNKNTINHKNGIKTDNNACNLEFATQKENIVHSYEVLGRKGSAVGRSGSKNPNSKPVLQYTLDMELIAEYPCIEGAAKSVNCTGGYFSSVCNGRFKTQIVRGYIWKFKDQDNE